MKRKKRLLILLLIIVLGAGVFFLSRPGHSRQFTGNNPLVVKGSLILPHVVMPYLQNGDIILRMSDSTWSLMFSDYSLIDKRFSHLGIVRMHEDGSITIIHSLGSLRNRRMGVSEMSLNHFLQVASSIGVFRVKNADGDVITETALQYVGRPFDFDFNLDDESEIYCTELLYTALRPLGMEHILSTVYAEQVDMHVIPLEAISHSPDIEEIIYIVLENFVVQYNDQFVAIDNHAREIWYQRFLLNILSRVKIRRRG